MIRGDPATTWRLTAAVLISALALALSEGYAAIWWGADPLIGAVTLLLLLFRRRFPMLVAAVITAATAIFATATGPALVALVSLGTRRRWRECALVFTLWTTAGLFHAFVGADDFVSGALESLFLRVASFAACIGIGAAVGSQREVVDALRARAESAEHEQASRIARAQASERARIAREMHDVLAHRISLIAMHAGALSFRPDLPREQIQRTTELLRDNADRAVGELRDVLGVLRDHDEVEEPRAPLADLTALAQLRAESAQADGDVELNVRLDAPHTVADVPGTLSRTAYRVVQEALTNARKHAPGMPVRVDLGGGPGPGLSFVIRNPPVAYGTVSLSGGESGMGLIGLTERVTLVGGALSYGTDRAGDFVVHGTLPWGQEGSR